MTAPVANLLTHRGFPIIETKEIVTKSKTVKVFSGSNWVYEITYHDEFRQHYRCGFSEGAGIKEYYTDKSLYTNDCYWSHEMVRVIQVENNSHHAKSRFVDPGKMYDVEVDHHKGICKLFDWVYQKGSRNHQSSAVHGAKRESIMAFPVQHDVAGELPELDGFMGIVSYTGYNAPYVLTGSHCHLVYGPIYGLVEIFVYLPGTRQKYLYLSYERNPDGVLVNKVKRTPYIPFEEHPQKRGALLEEIESNNDKVYYVRYYDPAGTGERITGKQYRQYYMAVHYLLTTVLFQSADEVSGYLI